MRARLRQIGTIGTIAEFAWDPGEAIRFEDAGAVSAATARGRSATAGGANVSA